MTSAKLTKATFSSVMVALGDRFQRPLSKMLLAAYWDALSSELTEDEFLRGARIVYRNAKFFPSPAEFVEAVKPVEPANALAMRALVALRSAITETRTEAQIVVYHCAKDKLPEDIGTAVLAGLAVTGQGTQVMEAIRSSDMRMVNLFLKAVENFGHAQERVAKSLPAAIEQRTLTEGAAREVTTSATEAQQFAGTDREA